jgi:hypothetical protein
MKTTFWLENLKGRNHSIKSKLQTVHNEIRRRLNSGNAYHHSVRPQVSFALIFRNQNTIYCNSTSDFALVRTRSVLDKNADWGCFTAQNMRV